MLIGLLNNPTYLLNLWSLIWDLDDAVGLFMASVHSHSAWYLSIASFRLSSTVWQKFERGIFPSAPPFEDYRRWSWLGIDQFDNRPWVPISSPMTHVVHLVVAHFLSYLASRFFFVSVWPRPSLPDTMTEYHSRSYHFKRWKLEVKRITCMKQTELSFIENQWTNRNG